MSSPVTSVTRLPINQKRRQRPLPTGVIDSYTSFYTPILGVIGPLNATRGGTIGEVGVGIDYGFAFRFRFRLGFGLGVKVSD